MIDLQPRTNRLDFGTDLDPGVDPGWIFFTFPTWRDRAFYTIQYNTVRDL